jgi:hypothetical protein
LRTIRRADPDDHVVSVTAEDGETGEGRARAAVAAEASDLHVVPSACPFMNRPQGAPESFGINWNTEVRPIDMVVWPWRLPALVEIEPVVRPLVAAVGITRIERHTRDGSPVRQRHMSAVSMHRELPVFVLAVGTPRRLSLRVPDHVAIGAQHHDTSLGHV